MCYPAFSAPPAAGQSQIEPTRALANRRKPRRLTHKVLIQVDTILLSNKSGSRYPRPSGRSLLFDNNIVSNLRKTTVARAQLLEFGTLFVK